MCIPRIKWHLVVCLQIAVQKIPVSIYIEFTRAKQINHSFYSVLHTAIVGQQCHISPSKTTSVEMPVSLQIKVALQQTLKLIKAKALCSQCSERIRNVTADQ